MVRSKLTQLDPGVVMASPSPRVVVIWDNSHGPQHCIAYLGFETAEAADICHRWLVGKVGKFNRKANAGVNLTRRAKRVDGASYEIKIHQPPVEVLQAAIQKDLARSAVAVAA